MKYRCSCGNLTDNIEQILDITLHTCDECKEKIRKKVEFQSEGETWRENNIICPFCGYEYDDYDSYSYEYSEDEVECVNCGKKFDLTVEDIRYFSTQKSLCEMESEVQENEN